MTDPTPTPPRLSRIQVNALLQYADAMEKGSLKSFLPAENQRDANTARDLAARIANSVAGETATFTSADVASLKRVSTDLRKPALSLSQAENVSPDEKRQADWRLGLSAHLSDAATAIERILSL